jgi:predicted O-methyltransferase YrrM
MFYFRVVKYLNYILLSRHKRGHGIHSPFIFDLVSRVFRNKIDPDIVFNIEQVRKKMTADKKMILVKDLGAGSKILKTKLRRVSDIARYSPVSRKYGMLLSKMAAEFGSPLVIELGTSLGISTMYMASSCTDARVRTIEGCPEIAGIAKDNFAEAGLGNIELIEGSFDDVLQSVTDSDVKPGLVFIDGNHRKEPVLKYFNMIADISGSATVIVIDDINYSKEMGEAWKTIKLHEKVSVSVDICRMGIVFFREGINHKDYVIRY